MSVTFQFLTLWAQIRCGPVLSPAINPQHPADGRLFLADFCDNFFIVVQNSSPITKNRLPVPRNPFSCFHQKFKPVQRPK